MGADQPKPPKLYAIEIQSQEESKDSTPIYRSADIPDKLISNFEEPLHSVYQLFELSVKTKPDNKCIGVKQIPEDGSAPFYKWNTYAEANQEVLKSAKIIQKHQLLSGELNFLPMVAPICPEWLYIDLALNLLGGVSVPFYQSLGPAGVKHIFEQTNPSTLFASCADLVRLLKEKTFENLNIKKMLVVGGISDELRELAGTSELIDYAQEMINEEIQSIELNIPQPDIDKVVTLSYTSGTTGPPKGAMITNRNVIACAASTYTLDTGPQKEHVQLLYLPLAHVMGRVGLYYHYGRGTAHGIFGGDYTKIMEDVQILKPTGFTAVPRIMMRLYDGIKSKVDQGSWLKRKVFYRALNTKLRNLRTKGELKSGFYDKIIFSKIQAVLGGRVESMATGSAAIAPEVLQFFRVVFGCDVLEGYGQTECTAVSFATAMGDNSYGHVGGPIPAIEFKLVDVPELNYLHTDKPHPRGEICIRGATIIPGYYKNPQKTAEAIDAEGWLHSGDIGMLVEGNAMRIIDRKKNIFKLSQGEYIAPQNLERVYVNCPLIQQIFVHGASLKNHIVAIIVPDKDVVMHFAKENKLQSQDYDELYNCEMVEAAITKQLEDVANAYKLNSLEKIRSHFLLRKEPFTPDDVLTPTMKLMRHRAAQFFKEEIETLYKA